MTRFITRGCGLGATWGWWGGEITTSLATAVQMESECASKPKRDYLSPCCLSVCHLSWIMHTYGQKNIHTYKTHKHTSHMNTHINTHTHNTHTHTCTHTHTHTHMHEYLVLEYFQVANCICVQFHTERPTQEWLQITSSDVNIAHKLSSAWPYLVSCNTLVNLKASR